MSPFVKAKFAACFVVLLAVSTMSAQVIANTKPGTGGTGTTPPIVYNGGPVMSANPVNVYIIWYGSWNATGSDTPDTQNLVQHFISSFSGSPLALVNTLYNDSTGPVSGTYQLGGPGGSPAVNTAYSSTFDTTTASTNPVSAFSSTFTSSGGTVSSTTTSTSTKTSTKKNITDGGVEKLVATTLNNGQLPRDPNGVYLVLTSSDINESSEGGFCGAPSSTPSKSGFCGWHNHAPMGGVDIKFAFIGNPDRCAQLQTAGQCEVQTTGPNSPAVGVGGADGMVNIIAHEISEATTDPDMDAWHNSASAENADVCNFNFGFKSLCGTGGLCSTSGNFEASWYNQTFGNNNWLIQQLGEPNQSPPSCVPHL
ncbi:MAG TPA: hypothetical protein VLN58_11870 [Verrucomicrobiae bacterium]|nr:hypothetical protein [Verrucomicrobiae bacterium]